MDRRSDRFRLLPDQYLIRDPDWLLLPRLFNAAECAAIIAAAHKLRPEAGDMTWTDNTEYPEVRSSTLRWIYRTMPGFEWIFAAVDGLAAACDRHFGVASEPHDAFQFTEYRVDRGGHYDWHHDSFDAAHDRVLSLCVQLSEVTDYQGGALELRCDRPPPKSLVRQRGAALAFRGSLEHRVTPITAGRRFSLVTWRLGDTAAMIQAEKEGRARPLRFSL